MDQPNKIYVPLEEALVRAGVGLYTNYVILVSGVVLFSSFLGIQVMATVMPVAGCELGLSNYEKGLLNSAIFTGMVAAAFFFGFVADLYGRRRLMLICLAINMVLTLLGSLAPEFYSLTVIWLLNGFILGGVFTPAYVYVSEFCPEHVRARAILVPSCFSSLAMVYLPGLAWLMLPWKLSLALPFGVVITSWRVFITLANIPITLISFIMLYKLPDTPKYILNEGREEEALDILRSIYALNNHKHKQEYPVEYICLDLDDMMAKQKGGQHKSCLILFKRMISQTIILFRPPFLLYSLICIGILFGIIGSYNTLFLWFPEQMSILMRKHNLDMNYNATMCDVMSTYTSELEDNTSCKADNDIFIITMICALLQSALFLIVSFVADRAGRKLLIMIFGGLSCVFSIGIIYANTFLFSVSTLTLTTVSLSVIFPLSFSIMMGYFPTPLRSTASSLTMASARFGATAGSQIVGAMFQNYCVEAYWGLSVILIISIALCILMPNKRKLQLEE